MIQGHVKTNFINGIQIPNQSPWFKPMAIYLSKAKFSLAISKLSSHWQHQSPILIGNIKAQFSLAIYLSKAQFSLAILNPNSHQQYQSPILIDNIKAQFSLATSKPNFHWQYLKPNSHWQYQSPILIGDIKSPTYVGTIKRPKLITWHYFIESPRLSILGKILHRNYFT